MAGTSEAKKASPPRTPIEGYDGLSIKAILPLLKTLNGRDLKAVTAYEKAGRNRITLLRAVRKIELAREAAGPQRPAKTQLTVVEPPLEAPVEAPVESVVDDLDAGFDLQDTDFIVDEWPAESPAEARAADAKEAKAKAKSAKTPRTGRSSKTAKVAKIDAPIDAPAPVEAADSIDVPDLADFDYDEAISEIDDPAPLKASAGKPSRPRSQAKAATWEEELRPQLPRRFESSAYDEIDPPVIALVPPTPAVTPTTAKAPKPKAPKAPKVPKAVQAVQASRAPAGTEPAPEKSLLVRRFESVALVMAAILAILLGLAIGTVLARTGSSDASPTPTSISQSASSQTTG